MKLSVAAAMLGEDTGGMRLREGNGKALEVFEVGGGARFCQEVLSRWMPPNFSRPIL